MKKRHCQRINRNGMGVIDVIVSVALMGLVLGIGVQMSSVLLRHRVVVASQRSNAEAISNLMEICRSLPFDDVDVTTIERLGAEVSDAEWLIDVEQVTHEVSKKQTAAKKVSLQVKSNSKLDRLRPALIAWRYPDATQSGEKE